MTTMKMTRQNWKDLIKVIVTVLTAIATSIGVASCK